MSFEFVCPYCFHKTRVDKSYAGRKGPCINCCKIVTMPKLVESSKASPSDSLSSPSPAPSWLEDNEDEQVDNRRAFRRRFFVAVGTVLGLAVVLGVGWLASAPFFKQLQSQHNVFMGRNNLQRIAAALKAYSNDHGSYPTPTVTDATGRPLYSWRVLLLPYLGEQGLYEKFVLTETWDSANNLGLVSKMPNVYAAPASPDANALGEACYMLIKGAGTLFPASGPLNEKAVTDSPAETLLVVEVRNQGDAWSKPSDLDISKLKLQINAKGNNAISSNESSSGASAAMVDGTSVILPPLLPGSTLRGLITPDGGEELDNAEWIR